MVFSVRLSYFILGTAEGISIKFRAVRERGTLVECNCYLPWELNLYKSY
jgi:hypothetical protein